MPNLAKLSDRVSVGGPGSSSSRGIVLDVTVIARGVLRLLQTVGELSNSLSALAGNMVERITLGDDVLANPNATLSAVGISGSATLTVTFTRAPRFHLSHISECGDEVISSSDPTMLQRVFRTIDVSFMATPFGLELEVRCVAVTTPFLLLLKIFLLRQSTRVRVECGMQREHKARACSRYLPFHDCLCTGRRKPGVCASS